MGQAVESVWWIHQISPRVIAARDLRIHRRCGYEAQHLRMREAAIGISRKITKYGIWGMIRRDVIRDTSLFRSNMDNLNTTS